ncbi:hypothetical protein [Marinomonas balearica]|uniref:Uncharacterized protein n=1 Tax=Marinomonas balearica TaxID=491947 RepID=A0A4R6M6J9_9GAMM|nr:hypothetical protein [Marinomonas balearica]TDO96726.1 hypothetical protein DFP79_2492 [Marinomonas balearica]
MKEANFYKEFIKKHKKYSSFFKTHLDVIVNLFISLFFAFLPLIISSAVSAYANKKGFFDEFSNLVFSEVMFLYCSSFIAPFFMMSFKKSRSKKPEGNFFDFLSLLLVFYILVAGALMYSGVLGRNLFALDLHESSINYPTTADISIICATFFVWYYCIFTDSYIPNDSMDNYKRNEFEAYREFDEELDR